MRCTKIITTPEGYKVCADNGIVLDNLPIAEESYDNIEDYFRSRVERRPRTKNWASLEELATWLLKTGFCEKFSESPTRARKEFNISARLAYMVARKYCGYKNKRVKRHLSPEELAELRAWAQARRRTWREIVEKAKEYGVNPTTIYRWLRRWGLI